MPSQNNLRLLLVIPRLGHLSAQEFRTYYESTHAPLGLEHMLPDVEFYRRDYVQDHLVGNADYDVMTYIQFNSEQGGNAALKRLSRSQVKSDGDKIIDRERWLDYRIMEDRILKSSDRSRSTSNTNLILTIRHTTRIAYPVEEVCVLHEKLRSFVTENNTILHCTVQEVRLLAGDRSAPHLLIARLVTSNPGDMVAWSISMRNLCNTELALVTTESCGGPVDNSNLGAKHASVFSGKD